MTCKSGKASQRQRSPPGALTAIRAISVDKKCASSRAVSLGSRQTNELRSIFLLRENVDIIRG
jgi:hypothetical protein